MHKNKTKKQKRLRSKFTLEHIYRKTSITITHRQVKPNIDHHQNLDSQVKAAFRNFLFFFFFAMCYVCGVVLVVPRETQMQDIPRTLLGRYST